MQMTTNLRLLLESTSHGRHSLNSTMTLSKKLSDDQLSIALGENSLERGKRYYRQGRVTRHTIHDQQEHSVTFSALVKGTKAKPYSLSVSIRWSINYQTVTIAGKCSCPIAYNCKHVAAACFAYQNTLTASVTKTIDRGCLIWLDSLDNSVIEDSNPNSEFIAYVLKPQAQKTSLTVELLLTRIKKMGGLTKGQSKSITTLKHELLLSQGKPKFLVEEDELIIHLLNGQTSYYYQPQLRGAIGSMTLEKMLETGRLYWQSLDSPPLVLGPPRKLNFEWQSDAHDNFHLKINANPEDQLIFTEPAYYLEPAKNLLGLLDCAPLNNHQLQKLLSAPPVPANVADEFSQRLLTQHPQLPLPPPINLDLTDCKGLQPQPHLTLLGSDTPEGMHWHLLKLTFDYGPHRLSAKEGEAVTTVKTAQGYLRIHRQVEEEGHFLDQLFTLGFERFQENKHPDCLFHSPGMHLIERIERWNDLLQNQLQALRNQGWQIEIDPSFQLQFRAADDWKAEIEESRHDWFDMHFEIEVNGQSQPLLPLLMPVIKAYDILNIPEVLTIPLGQHEYLTVASEKLKPFLAVLYEMFDSISLTDRGSLRLSRFDASTLAELESHSYGLFSLTGGEALLQLGRKLRQFEGLTEITPPDNLQAELRNYQRQGLNWLQFLREYQFGGILADDMGLGKTLQTLAHLLVEKQNGRLSKPSLIIAPTSLMSNWRREATRFTPDLRVLVLQGYERKQHFDAIADYDLVLTTYPLLPRDEDFLMMQPYYYLILDEAQIVKNPNAKAAKIVRTIQAEHRLCLTGTPMENHLGELWTQFDFLMPGFLGDSAHFKRLYRTPIEIHGDSEQRQRLSKRIAPFMLRRTKQAVVAELPAKTEIVRSVPLGSQQAILYESIRLAMEQKVQAAIAEKGLARSHITILDALLKLRQTCCDPRTLPLNAAQKVKESAKLELLMEMLPELLEEGRRILIFSQFTRMIALIEKELTAMNILYSKLTGQTKQRDEAIERFKNGEVDVFLISLKAGGVGLNLTEADTVIVYDPWWNPAAEAQAADRAHRIGQDKPVFVYKLITENTVEEKILAIQERKRALAQGVYDGGKKGETFNLTSEDLSLLFEPL